MAGETDKVPVITYGAGFLKGRVIALDTETGEEVMVPGRLVRLRCSTIVWYGAGLQGCVEIYPDWSDDPMIMLGSCEQIDKIMERDRLVMLGVGNGS